VRYALVGHGRMGRAIETAAADRGHQRVASVDSADVAIDAASLAGAEVAFEFTRPEAAASNVLALLAAGVGVICGTTGWSPDRAIDRSAGAAAGGLIVAPNFSIGVNLFFRMTRQAGRMLAAAGIHQPFVSEMHHRGKLDAPSGTARRLAEILIEEDPRLGGMLAGNPDGPLPPDMLQVVSVRAGGEPGTHTVGFDGEQDRIVLQHSARSRAGFALGAVIGAEWIRDKQGMHGFDEVLDDLLRRNGKSARGALGQRGGSG